MGSALRATFIVMDSRGRQVPLFSYPDHLSKGEGGRECAVCYLYRKGLWTGAMHEVRGGRSR